MSGEKGADFVTRVYSVPDTFRKSVSLKFASLLLALGRRFIISSIILV